MFDVTTPTNQMLSLFTSIPFAVFCVAVILVLAAFALAKQARCVVPFASGRVEAVASLAIGLLDLTYSTLSKNFFVIKARKRRGAVFFTEGWGNLENVAEVMRLVLATQDEVKALIDRVEDREKVAAAGTTTGEQIGAGIDTEEEGGQAAIQPLQALREAADRDVGAKGRGAERDEDEGRSSAGSGHLASAYKQLAQELTPSAVFLFTVPSGHEGSSSASRSPGKDGGAEEDSFRSKNFGGGAVRFAVDEQKTQLFGATGVEEKGEEPLLRCTSVTFRSPLAKFLPTEAAEAKFTLVERLLGDGIRNSESKEQDFTSDSNKEWSATHPPRGTEADFVFLFPYLGEIGMKSRLRMARTILRNREKRTFVLIPTPPFYGSRRVARQVLHFSLTAEWFWLESMGLVSDSAALVEHFLLEKQLHIGQIVCAGYSWGGAMASIVGVSIASMLARRSYLLRYLQQETKLLTETASATTGGGGRRRRGGRGKGYKQDLLGSDVPKVVIVPFCASATSAPVFDGVLRHDVDWEKLRDQLEPAPPRSTSPPPEPPTYFGQELTSYFCASNSSADLMRLLNRQQLTKTFATTSKPCSCTKDGILNLLVCFFDHTANLRNCHLILQHLHHVGVKNKKKESLHHSSLHVPIVHCLSCKHDYFIREYWAVDLVEQFLEYCGSSVKLEWVRGGHTAAALKKEGIITTHVLDLMKE